MKKVTIIIATFLITTSTVAQIVGEWMLSHSFDFKYDEFDMKEMDIENKTILILNEDSMRSIHSEEWRKQMQFENKYSYDKDSIYAFEGRRKLAIQLIVSKDTLMLIDKKIKGFYSVFLRIKPSKRIYSPDQIKRKVIGKSFKFKPSEIFIDTWKKSFNPIDVLTFKKDYKAYSNSIEPQKWKVLKSPKNLFLCIDDILFQVFSINKRKIILKSYFKKDNTVKLKLVKQKHD